MDNLQQVQQYTVQEHEPRESIGGTYVWVEPLADDLLPAWGTHGRDRVLRRLYRGLYAWVAQSAVAALTKRVKQTPSLLDGGRNLKSYYHQLLYQDAEFGAGWGEFVSKLLLDFLTCDYGAYIEVIGAGPADGPLRGRVLGLAHLDSLRCVPTGNLEFPVVYWSRRTGKMHRLHHTRVIRWMDMPDGDQAYFTPGLCALSRAVSVIKQQTNLQQYITSSTSDDPPAGILYNTGINQTQWDDAYRAYQAKRQQGANRRLMVINADAEGVKGDLLTFASVPAGFDYPTYIEVVVNAFAACFGIDKQDLWPLTGRMAGTATQSAVLAEKARGMAFGDILQSLERIVNLRVLPPSLEFQFQYRDEEGDRERAERDRTIVGTAVDAQREGLFTPEEARRFMASQSDSLRDVLTTEDGDIAELPDDDVEDATPELVTTAPTEETEPTSAPPPDTLPTAEGEKAIQATRLDFEADLEDLIAGARSGDVTRRRFGIILRDLLRKYGLQAYKDGLLDGGIEDDELDDDDTADYLVLLAAQSVYVTGLGDTLYSDGITDAEAAQKPQMWWNKSLRPFYDAGRLSADKNGLYEFAGDDGEESCSTCSRLKGQRHRLKDWVRRQLRPGVDTNSFECKGFQCKHILVKTEGRARGRF